MSTFSLLGSVPAEPSRAAAGGRLGLAFDDVLAAAQVGAEWAWTQLYRSIAPSVRGYLISRGAQDADDLVGEVFLQLARNLATFEGDEASFRAWVFTIAHHRVIDEHRRRRRRPAISVADVPEVAGTDENEMMGGLLTAEARALLDELTEEQREVLLLRVFADLSLEDVSRIVGRPVSAVKSLQHRALATLRKKLSQEPYPDGPVWR